MSVDREDWYKVEMWVIGLTKPPTDNLQFRQWINEKVTIIDDLVIRTPDQVPTSRPPRQVKRDVLLAITNAQRRIRAIRGKRPMLFSDRYLIAEHLMETIPELGWFSEEVDPYGQD